MGWHNPIGGSRIKMLKMLGAVGGLFLVSFLPLIYCDLENQINLDGKKVSIFQRS